jgi:hypothetical protein
MIGSFAQPQGTKECRTGFSDSSFSARASDGRFVRNTAERTDLRQSTADFVAPRRPKEHTAVRVGDTRSPDTDLDENVWLPSEPLRPASPTLYRVLFENSRVRNLSTETNLSINQLPTTIRTE